MVEILKTAPTYSVTIKCTGHGNGGEGCGATLRAERSDLRYFSETDQLFNVVPAAVTVKCPACGITTDLPKKSWPPRVKELEKWTGEWRAAPVKADG